MAVVVPERNPKAAVTGECQDRSRRGSDPTLPPPQGFSSNSPTTTTAIVLTAFAWPVRFPLRPRAPAARLAHDRVWAVCTASTIERRELD
jgi:hypothetical protein